MVKISDEQPPLAYRLQQVHDIEQAVQLRADARDLRKRVSRGSYTDSELAEFWELTSTAGLKLHESNVTLAETAGLGATYFSSVSKERRRPKLENMLRALTAIEETATERLRDVEGDGGSDWIELKISAQDRDQYASILRELVAALRESNSLSANPHLDLAWRNELIALLETTIELLKAPLIEKSLLRRVQGGLATIAGKTGDYAVGGVVGSLAFEGAKVIAALLG